MPQTNLNPLAQTFVVDNTQFPSGIFLHSIDLWFSNKDSRIPLKIQIRPVVNGYPDSNAVVPFSDILVRPCLLYTSPSPRD